MVVVVVVGIWMAMVDDQWEEVLVHRGVEVDGDGLVQNKVGVERQNK